MKTQVTYGFLQTCIDRRFVAKTRALFEKTTGLSEIDYWHESVAGGSAIDKEDTLGEDFAKSQGVKVFGWQAHGDVCGGQPDIDNETIYQRLIATAQEKKKKFPNDKHYLFFAIEGKITMQEL